MAEKPKSAIMERQSIHRSLPVLDLKASQPPRFVGLKPTPEHPLIVSASELRDFLRCRVRWYWRYRAKLQPKGGKEALDMGTLVHEISEAWYSLAPGMRTVKAMKTIATLAVKKTKLQALDTEARELVQAMVIGYAVWALDPDNADSDVGIKLGVCHPEEEFSLPLVADGSILVRGKLDNCFEPHKKIVAIQELKTAKQFRDKGLDILVQLSVYLWALRVKYPKKARFKAYYTEMRKQLPTDRVRAPLFQRQVIERTDAEVDQWVRDVQLTALDMLDPAIYPNPNANCSWDCDFQIPCMARGTDDLEYILQQGFQPKEKR